MSAGTTDNRQKGACRAIAIGLGIVVGLSVMTSLAVHPGDSGAPVGGTGGGVSFERIVTHYPLKPDPRLWVIQDEANWSAFWYAYLAVVGPQPAPPAINFTQNTVLVLSQGMRPTGGYGLTITVIYHRGEDLQVEAQETDPGSGCFVTPALMWLYDIVKVSKTTAPLAVLLHWNVGPCPQS